MNLFNTKRNSCINVEQTRAEAWEWALKMSSAVKAEVVNESMEVLEVDMRQVEARFPEGWDKCAAMVFVRERVYSGWVDGQGNW